MLASIGRKSSGERRARICSRGTAWRPVPELSTGSVDFIDASVPPSVGRELEDDDAGSLFIGLLRKEID